MRPAQSYHRPDAAQGEVEVGRGPEIKTLISVPRVVMGAFAVRSIARLRVSVAAPAVSAAEPLPKVAGLAPTNMSDASVVAPELVLEMTAPSAPFMLGL